jgi:hypothetical protein
MHATLKTPSRGFNPLKPHSGSTNYWAPDFRWSDAHADNLFACGFQYGAEDASCIAATTFEVMEHVERPVEFVEELLSAARTRT